MTEHPIVSINISVYNAADYIAETIESLLKQTFTDFEIIVINDGSTDNTEQILAQFNDERLFIFSQENRGIPKSRNLALRKSKGQFIAVMDGDDISLPERLATQVDFLNKHPDIGMVGSACTVWDDISDKKWDFFPPLSDDTLKKYLIRGNPFVHTSIMLRKNIIDKVDGYNESFPILLDYELFVRLAPHTKFANLPNVLVIHRHHLNSVSMAPANELRRLWLRIRIYYKIWRTFNLSFYNIIYIIQPIIFFLVELKPKLKHYFRKRSF